MNICQEPTSSESITRMDVLLICDAEDTANLAEYNRVSSIGINNQRV
jgi:hypothetical protein